MLGADTILQDRYRIVRPLGRGGMGAVYEATDLRLSRTVALKETLAETDDLRRAFEREARLLANLRHPALPALAILLSLRLGGNILPLGEEVPPRRRRQARLVRDDREHQEKPAHNDVVL